MLQNNSKLTKQTSKEEIQPSTAQNKEESQEQIEVEHIDISEKYMPSTGEKISGSIVETPSLMQTKNEITTQDSKVRELGESEELKHDSNQNNGKNLIWVLIIVSIFGGVYAGFKSYIDIKIEKGIQKYIASKNGNLMSDSNNEPESLSKLREYVEIMNSDMPIEDESFSMLSISMEGNRVTTVIQSKGYTKKTFPNRDIDDLKESFIKTSSEDVIYKELLGNIKKDIEYVEFYYHFIDKNFETLFEFEISIYELNIE